MATIVGSQAPGRLALNPLEVGDRFMRERETAGMSRADLAAICGYSTEQVRQVETGKKIPGGRLLAGLAAIGGDLRYVLAVTQAPEPLSEIEAIDAARFRDAVRREAREHARLRADRRKKVLADEEADIIEMLRTLPPGRQRQVAEFVMSQHQLRAEPEQQPGIHAGKKSVIAAGPGAIAVGGRVSSEVHHHHSPTKRASKKRS